MDLQEKVAELEEVKLYNPERERDSTLMSHHKLPQIKETKRRVVLFVSQELQESEVCQDELALRVKQLKAELVLFKGLVSNVRESVRVSEALFQPLGLIVSFISAQLALKLCVCALRFIFINKQEASISCCLTTKTMRTDKEQQLILLKNYS